MSKPYDQCHCLEEHFLYFLDCQLATVEQLESLAKPPKGRLNRQRGLARKMIATARAYDLPVHTMSRVTGFEATERAHHGGGLSWHDIEE